MASSSTADRRQGKGLLAGLARRLGIGGGDDAAVAQRLYAACVAQARRPVPYADWAVPDEAAGRFEMVILHCLMLTRALAAQGADGARLAQALSDRLFADMDPSLRELGVSDIALGREMLKLAETYMARARDMSPLWATDGATAELDALLQRNVYAGRDVDPRCRSALARYLVAQAAQVASLPADDLLAGRVTWLEPRSDGANAVDPARAGA